MDNMFVLISPNTDKEGVRKYLDDNELSHLKIWTESSLPEFINPLEPIIILLLSGGTELMVKRIVEKAFSSIFVNCVPMNNALSAGAELNGYYYANTEITVRSYTEDNFKLLFNIEKYKTEINKSRLLLIGRPHEWVLTSEFLAPPSPFHTKIVPVRVKELLHLQELVDAQKATAEAEYWVQKADTQNLPISEFYSGSVLYLAIKKLLERHDGNMLALRCTELQQKCSSLCLAMDRLNEEGIMASCEGDLEAAFSMKIINQITGKQGWMMNISHIDFTDNLLYLTHCAVPMDMFNLNSTYLFNNAPDYNFIEEFLDIKQPLDVTIFRISKDQRYDLLEGTVNTEIIGKRNQCRSTMQVQSNSSLYEWYEEVCGNHQIVVYGKYADQLRHFFDILYH